MSTFKTFLTAEYLYESTTHELVGDEIWQTWDSATRSKFLAFEAEIKPIAKEFHVLREAYELEVERNKLYEAIVAEALPPKRQQKMRDKPKAKWVQGSGSLSDQSDGKNPTFRQTPASKEQDAAPEEPAPAEGPLTPEQIQTIFHYAELHAIGLGDFKTTAGKVGSGIAAAAGIPKEMVGKVNDAINKLGKTIQDSGPVQKFDAAFDNGVQNLKAKLGGDDSKIVQYTTALSDWAKANPGKASFAISALTVAASFAGGPVGGAVAGQLLRGANELLKGEKLSTAIGKGAKTAALGYAAGKVMDFSGDKIKDFFDNANKEEIAKVRKALTDAKTVELQDEVRQQYGSAVNIFRNNPELKDLSKLKIQISDSTYGFHPFDVLMTADEEAKYRAMDSIRLKINYLRTITNNNLRSGVRDLYDQGMEAARAMSQAGTDAWKDPEIQAQLAQMTGNAAKDSQIMKSITDTASALAQGAVTGASSYEPKKGQQQQNRESVEYSAERLIESYTYAELEERHSRLQMKKLAGIQLTEAELYELGAWDKIKQGAKAVGGAVAKGAKAVGNAASAIGKELGQKITKRKLTSMWKDAGEPTDTKSIFDLIVNTGLSPGSVTSIFDRSKVAIPPGVNAPGRGDNGQDNVGSDQNSQKQTTSGKTSQPAQQSGENGTTEKQPGNNAKNTARPGQPSSSTQSASSGATASSTGTKSSSTTNQQPSQQNVQVDPAQAELKAKLQAKHGSKSGIAQGVSQAQQKQAEPQAQPQSQAAQAQGDGSVMKGIGRAIGKGARAAVDAFSGKSKTQQAAPEPAQQRQAAPQPSSEPAKQQPAQQGADKSSQQNINNYVKGVASQINQAQGREKMALAKEVVNFMADRQGTPEWENAVGTVKQVLKKAGLDQNFANSAMQRLANGKTMESIQMQFINALLEATGLTFADLGLHETIVQMGNAKSYIVEDAEMVRLRQLAGI